MKWINPGIAILFDSHNNVTQSVDNKSQTNVSCLLDGSTGSFLYKNIYEESCTEIWFSYDVRMVALVRTETLFTALDSSGKQLIRVTINNSDFALKINDANDSLLYKSDKLLLSTDNSLHNLEFHFKTGENGRIDVWLDTKLYCSFRSPSAFSGNIKKIGLKATESYIGGSTQLYVSSFILQDTRRIGLEKFKKLTIDPDTEQNMPQGSTTTYRLSGLSDATEFSDITSVCALLQATSRDANISTGTFSLEGADVGTIDVSDSSGKAYEIAHAETNSLTGKPWTRDDIEGKTLSFKVNGAS